MASSNRSNKFVPPTAEQRAQALGETEKLNEDIRRAITVAIDDSFPLMPIPNEGDWLSEHYEAGQTVQEFKKLRKTRPSSTCNIIYIQPIGDFNGPRAPNLDIICNFCLICFPGCQIEILPSIEFDAKMKKRINSFTKQAQYLTGNLTDHFKKMQRKRENRHELFSIGVTMADIYPDPKWNFVYGEASVDDGIGIFSFARFDPLFPDSSIRRPCTDEERIIILKRAVNTCLHEIMHLFGLEHCIYYLCLMNGANCESEMDRQCLYLCPICLRKMHLSFEKQDFHVIKMYERMLELCEKVGFQDEAIWYENRLKVLNTNS